MILAYCWDLSTRISRCPPRYDGVSGRVGRADPEPAVRELTREHKVPGIFPLGLRLPRTPCLFLGTLLYIKVRCAVLQGPRFGYCPFPQVLTPEDLQILTSRTATGK